MRNRNVWRRGTFDNTGPHLPFQKFLEDLGLKWWSRATSVPLSCNYVGAARVMVRSRGKAWRCSLDSCDEETVRVLKARGGDDGVARFAICTSSRQAFFVFKSPKTEKNVNALVLPATWKPAAFRDEWAEVCAPHPAHTRSIPHHRPWLVCRWRRPSMCCTIRRSKDDGTTCPSSSH